jgi:hypothetical protein
MQLRTHEVIMSTSLADRLRDSSLPAALAALSQEQQAQEHPTLLLFIQNLTEHVLERSRWSKSQDDAINNLFYRVAKLERANHARG